MSYWAITVITNMVVQLPVYGDVLVRWCLGGHVVGATTLGRLYTIHTVFPFILVCISCIHMFLLHYSGSSTELGVSVSWLRVLARSVPFGPYYVVKDLFVVLCITSVYMLVACTYGHLLQLPINNIGAKVLITPEHIIPEWYFLTIYAFIRDAEALLYGIICLCIYFVLLFVKENVVDCGYTQQLLNRTQMRSIQYVYTYCIALCACILELCGLGMCIAYKQRLRMNVPAIYAHTRINMKYIALCFVTYSICYVVCGITELAIAVAVQCDLIGLSILCSVYVVNTVREYMCAL